MKFCRDCRFYVVDDLRGRGLCIHSPLGKDHLGRTTLPHAAEFWSGPCNRGTLWEPRPTLRERLRSWWAGATK